MRFESTKPSKTISRGKQSCDSNHSTKPNTILSSWKTGREALKGVSQTRNNRDNFSSGRPAKRIRRWTYGGARIPSQSAGQLTLQPRPYYQLDKRTPANTLSSEEMKAFFSRSLTGIRSLVNEQYKQVERVTGKPPKVCHINTPLCAYSHQRLENSPCRRFGKFSLYPWRVERSVQGNCPQTPSWVSSHL